MCLGVHVSTAGHVYEAVDRAVALDCTAMQIFSRNPRQWRSMSLSEEEAAEFRRRRRRSGLKVVAVHVPYLINLATPFEELYTRSVEAYVEDIREAERLGAEYLVTHMGSYKNSTPEAGLSQFTKAIKIILERTRGLKIKLLLENTSGSGNWLGATFDHPRTIMGGSKEPGRLGICLDTAHVFASGVDIRHPDVLDGLLDEIEKKTGRRSVRVVHLNDSASALGSRADRHAHIGKGEIGLKAMKHIVNHPKLSQAAFILETPKTTPQDDRMNLNRVRKLIKN
jgi:deoxyribonuclease-4